MSIETVNFFDHGDYAEIHLNRPEKSNAINAEMRAEIRRLIFEECQNFPVIILSATGDAFCAGMDLAESNNISQTNENSAADQGRITEAATELWEIAEAIYDHSSIFIAAINGAARGAGLTLTNASDLAIASENASFGMPEIRYGIYPGIVGPTTQLTIGRRPSAWMILTGEAMSAWLALENQLVNQVVAKENLRSEVQQLAKKLTGFDSDALAASKKALNRIPFNDVERSAAVAMGISTNGELLAQKKMKNIERFQAKN